MKIFLGGTCNGSTWRKSVEAMLDAKGIDYFNPVVEDWDEKARLEELEQRKTCDICLYTITPLMTGVYAIAEVVDDSNKRPDKTVMVVLKHEGPLCFDAGQMRSLGAVRQLVENNGSKTYSGLADFVHFLKG